MYHKIHPDSPSIWWVHVDEFYRHLLEFKSKKVVYLDDYDPTDPNHVVITFDGVYQNVLKYAAPLLDHHNYPFELFVSSDHIGKGNEFDRVDKRTGLETNEPFARFASKKELQKLVKMGGRPQWHSRSHPNLTEITDAKELSKELTVPSSLKKLDKHGWSWVAYPHGEFNQAVLEASKSRFEGGLSVIQGNDSDKYALNRVTATNDSSFAKAKIGVVIPCYNYGSFLPEAIESVERQTRPADKIIIINDGSTDNTHEIASHYQYQRPDKIEYIQNKKNLGIIATFNKAVRALDTEYVCLLGADNRFRSDYLEKTAALLDLDENLGVAYSDFALFGPLATTMFQMVQPDRRGPVIDDTYYTVRFPNFSKRIVDQLSESNFIHGSSLFRMSAWNQVGGYQDTSSRAEDHHLFYRMIKSGWKAKRVSEPILEYRQHSRDQVNTKLNSYAELTFYKQRTKTLQEELLRIHTSKFWKLLTIYKHPKSATKHYLKVLLKKILSKL